MTFEDKVEELRATLLEYDEDVVLEALTANHIIDKYDGTLTDYWLSLLGPTFKRSGQYKNFLVKLKKMVEDELK